MDCFWAGRIHELLGEEDEEEDLEENRLATFSCYRRQTVGSQKMIMVNKLVTSSDIGGETNQFNDK